VARDVRTRSLLNAMTRCRRRFRHALENILRSAAPRHRAVRIRRSGVRAIPRCLWGLPGGVPERPTALQAKDCAREPAQVPHPAGRGPMSYSAARSPTPPGNRQGFPPVCKQHAPDPANVSRVLLRTSAQQRARAPTARRRRHGTRQGERCDDSQAPRILQSAVLPLQARRHAARCPHVACPGKVGATPTIRGRVLPCAHRAVAQPRRTAIRGEVTSPSAARSPTPPGTRCVRRTPGSRTAARRRRLRAPRP
jgi:hypothetical protein